MLARPSAVAAAVLAVVALAAPVTATATTDPFGKGFRPCGSFHSHGYRIQVHAHGMSCRRARAIQREYWNGPRSRKVIVNGGSGAFGYILLKRYPGYRCTSGAGGGECATPHRAKVSAYQD